MTQNYNQLTSVELLKILGLTIKKDDQNKLVTFLCCLSAFTDSSQFNISYNAPSSSGKSYIPIQIAQLFPKDEVIMLSYCSPQAFYHDNSEYDKERKAYIVNLSRKIIVFLDMPNPQLLERLRSLLSHDQKEIESRITDKTQKSGMRAKKIFIRGFPSVIFCSAGLNVDEQESSRFVLLSPEIDSEKIRQGIEEKIKAECDKEYYSKWLDEVPERRLLKDRIEAIKNECINEIKIEDMELVKNLFLKGKKILKPRHQRDVGRLMSFIKTFALLNLWHREREGDNIVANSTDIDEGYKLWQKISESQEYNLPPYIYELYQKIIIPVWIDKNDGLEEKVGISRQEIIKKQQEIFGRIDVDWKLRQQILPMLDNSGLIIQEQDKDDKRRILIHPTHLLTISQGE